MIDNHWDLINGDTAHQIEILNAATQASVLSALLLFLFEHRGPLRSGVPPVPDEASLLSLHRASTLFLLADPGNYRNRNVHVATEDGQVIHQPPEWFLVAGAMQTFFRQLSAMWANTNPVVTAAYALWYINFVHPFVNGNGRTARAFSYVCLCCRIGNLIGGTKTIIEFIQEDRGEYQAGLKEADNSFRESGVPNLGRLSMLIAQCLQKQISSASVS